MIHKNIPTNKNIDSFTDFFVMTAMRLEALSEIYLLKPLGLTAASFKILSFIKNNDQCSPMDIICYLGGTKSNITQRLSFLEKNNLVSLSRQKTGDKRKVIISLTTQGLDKLKVVREVFHDKSIHIENFFSQEELNEHLNFMLKLSDILGQCEKKLCLNKTKNNK